MALPKTKKKNSVANGLGIHQNWWVVYSSSFWDWEKSGRIRWTKQVIFFVFSFRRDQNDSVKQKCVRVRKSCPVEALKVIRLSIIKFAKYYNLTSKFGSGSRNSKSSPRRVLLEMWANKLSIAFKVFSDRKTERDSSINLLTRSKDLSLLSFARSIEMRQWFTHLKGLS